MDKASCRAGKKIWSDEGGNQSAAHMTRTSKIQFKRILIATDFSEASRNALRYAVAIARHHEARLHIVHVVSSVGYKMVGPDAEVRAAELAARELKELWDKLEGKDHTSGIELTLAVRQGDTSSELEDVIKKEGIDLAVLGTRGRIGLSKLMLGSVAEEIFRRVSCPVLTAGPESAWDWPQREAGAEKTILYATDFGGASLKALPYAVSIANRSGSKLILLHVIKFVGAEGQAPIVGNTLNTMEEDMRRSSVQRLKQLVVEDLKREPEIRVTFSLPVDGILSAAAGIEAGLIVLGLNRKTRLLPSGHLPSTIAYNVVVAAQCPVLTVRS